MTDKEKAIELDNKFKNFMYSPKQGPSFQQCLMEMAEWKEQQMTKNAIDFLVKTIPCTDGFIEEFISAMKGE